MIPIKDHHPSSKTPLVTYGLILLNAAVFLAMMMMDRIEMSNFIHQYAFKPKEILGGINLTGLLTSMFLHGSFGHIIGNMLFLNIFGDNLEAALGKGRFLIFYLWCGLGASITQIIFNPNSLIPNIGASGAIAGVMAGYLVLFPRHQIDVLFSFGLWLQRARVPAYSMIFYWFLIQLFAGVGSLTIVNQLTGGVAYLAHVGGFVTGWLLIKLSINKQLNNQETARYFTGLNVF